MSDGKLSVDIDELTSLYSVGEGPAASPAAADADAPPPTLATEFSAGAVEVGAVAVAGAVLRV